MPLVQYVCYVQDVRRNAKFPTPKKVAKLEAWLKAACKALPDIPNPYKGESTIFQETANTQTIYWELRLPDQTKAYVVVDRTVPYAL